VSVRTKRFVFADASFLVTEWEVTRFGDGRFTMSFRIDGALSSESHLKVLRGIEAVIETEQVRQIRETERRGLA
jgi:hypothetical protein